MKNIMAVDFDNTLCDNVGNPKSGMVDYINNMYEIPSNFIIIYTARSYSVFHETRQWLLSNGVKHHALVMEKMRATTYIDDRSSWPAGVKK